MSASPDLASPDLAGRVEAVEGRGGRLFVSRTGDADARALYAEPWTDARRLRQLWGASVARLAALAEEIGARLLVLTPPDAHGVHEGDLPSDWRYARPSVGEGFAAAFGIHVEIVPLLDPLRAARGLTDPWRRTDSHWSAPGAYAAYRTIMDRLGPGVRVLQPEEVGYGWAEESGDLGGLSEPPRRAATPRATVATPRARSVLDRVNHRRHALKVFEQDDPLLPSAVVVRDSFATELAPFLAESFRRTVLVAAESRAFPDLIRDERPEVILYERAERALPCGVIDWDLTGWRENWPEPGVGPDETEAARAERDATRALDAGDAETSRMQAEAAVLWGPTPDRRLLLGRARLAGGIPALAAAAFEQALAEEPSRWSIALHLGIARLAHGRTELARDAFARAVALAPWHPRPLEHFGYACLQLGDPASARPALEEAVRLGPELAGSWLWLMEALQLLGDARALRRVRAEAEAAPVDIPGLGV